MYNNMGKNKPIKSNKSVKQSGKTGHELSNVKNKKPHRDGKPKQKDHLEQIPFRLREIMKSKERMKIPYNKKKAKKMKEAIIVKHSAEGSAVGDIPVPLFRRKKKETEKAYIRRMENETQHVLFLTKNQIERQPELEEEEEKPGVTKSDKKKEYDKVRLQRLHQKKLDRQVDMVEKDMFIDTVRFGEVAMAPPILSVKPRKAPIKSQGVSKGLLLNSMLGHTMSSTAKPSMARQRMMEEERVRVVEAYRHLKKQKQQQQDAKAAGIEKLKKL